MPLFIGGLIAANKKGSAGNGIPVGVYELHYPASFGSRFTIPADNPLTREGVYLGRLLFYETRLSANNRVSCATCHQQKLAFTDGKKFSQGVDGTLTRRNSMSLANLLWVRNLFWDGRVKGLEAQALIPLTDPHEMGQSPEVSAQKLRQTRLYPPIFKLVFGSDSITTEQIVKAIAQFERTLISADSPYDRYLAGVYEPTPQERRGLELFMTSADMETGRRGASCGHCHGGPKTFTEQFHNNGLDSLPGDPGRQTVTGLPNDQGRFRVATLRNIALTAPYMHDGRFATLEEVLDHYSEHIQAGETLSPFLRKANRLTKQEKDDIVAFLHMLTDSSFISNPEFSDPHVQHPEVTKQ